MNKIFNLILLSFFLPLCSFASGWDTTYRQIESNIKAPFFKNKSYVITKFGASLKADAAKNQAAINKAIATALPKAEAVWWCQKERGKPEASGSGAT